MRSIISRISTNFGLVYDRIGFFRTMISVEVAEVRSLAVEVQDVGQIDCVSDDSC
jgi:hypothetical protein